MTDRPCPDPLAADVRALMEAAGVMVTAEWRALVVATAPDLLERAIADLRAARTALQRVEQERDEALGLLADVRVNGYRVVDVLRERDRLAAALQRVTALADEWATGVIASPFADRVRAALVGEGEPT